MENKRVDFHIKLEEALQEISHEYQFRLLKETHYEANNRELRWTKGIKIYRLDFDYSGAVPNSISVTMLIDRFLFFPNVFEWCHDYIPGFPYCAKIIWEKLPDLPLGFSKDEYKEKIKLYIKEIQEMEFRRQKKQ